MRFDWKARFSNPSFYVQLALAVSTPVLAYMGITVQSINSWKFLLDIIMDALANPYILILTVISVFNAVVDPTTAGFCDKAKLEKENPKIEKTQLTNGADQDSEQ